MQKICQADVEGVTVGSTSIKFIPKKIQSLSLKENVGTAGSIPLILQVLIPVVSISKKELHLSLLGGTDGKWSPTSNYTYHVLREAWRRMGIQFSMNICRRGYYPKGGGEIMVNVSPSQKIFPLNLKKRISNHCKLFCSFSKISRKQIQNQIKLIEEGLSNNNFLVESEISNEKAIDGGASILICSKDSDSIIGVDSLYDHKTKSFEENIGQRFIENNLSVDENLSDMLVLPASLADGMTVFQVKNITKHLETNLYVTSKITGCRYGVGKLSDGYEIRIEGNSNPSI